MSTPTITSPLYYTSFPAHHPWDEHEKHEDVAAAIAAANTAGVPTTIVAVTDPTDPDFGGYCVGTWVPKWKKWLGDF